MSKWAKNTEGDPSHDSPRLSNVLMTLRTHNRCRNGKNKKLIKLRRHSHACYACNMTRAVPVMLATWRGRFHPIQVSPVWCPVRCRPSKDSSCHSQSPEPQPPWARPGAGPGLCRWPGRTGGWSSSPRTGWTRYSLQEHNRQEWWEETHRHRHTHINKDVW